MLNGVAQGSGLGKRSELCVFGAENSEGRRLFCRNRFRMRMVNGTQQSCVLGKTYKYILGCIFMKLAYKPYALNLLYSAL